MFTESRKASNTARSNALNAVIPRETIFTADPLKSNALGWLRMNCDRRSSWLGTLAFGYVCTDQWLVGALAYLRS